MSVVIEDAGAAPDGVPASTQPVNIKPLLRLMVEKRASDLFFSPNAPIKVKIEGQIYPVNKQVLNVEQVRQAAFGLMTPAQLAQFERDQEIDFAVSEAGLGRFRVNVFRQRGNPAMVMRYIAVRRIDVGEELTINYSGEGGHHEAETDDWFERHDVVLIKD